MDLFIDAWVDRTRRSRSCTRLSDRHCRTRRHLRRNETFLSHLVRSEGEASMQLGIAMGGILNMVLDRCSCFVIPAKGNEVLGAAVATPFPT